MDSSEMGQEEGSCVAVCVTVSGCVCGADTVSPLGGAVGEQFNGGCVDCDGGVRGAGCSAVVGICGVRGGE